MFCVAIIFDRCLHLCLFCWFIRNAITFELVPKKCKTTKITCPMYLLYLYSVYHHKFYRNIVCQIHFFNLFANLYHVFLHFWYHVPKMIWSHCIDIMLLVPFILVLLNLNLYDHNTTPVKLKICLISHSACILYSLLKRVLYLPFTLYLNYSWTLRVILAGLRRVRALI